MELGSEDPTENWTTVHSSAMDSIEAASRKHLDWFGSMRMTKNSKTPWREAQKHKAY